MRTGNSSKLSTPRKILQINFITRNFQFILPRPEIYHPVYPKRNLLPHPPYYHPDIYTPEICRPELFSLSPRNLSLRFNVSPRNCCSILKQIVFHRFRPEETSGRNRSRRFLVVYPPSQQSQGLVSVYQHSNSNYTRVLLTTPLP